jgi:hypothetical protein
MVTVTVSGLMGPGRRGGRLLAVGCGERGCLPCKWGQLGAAVSYDYDSECSNGPDRQAARCGGQQAAGYNEVVQYPNPASQLDMWAIHYSLI